MYFLVHPSGSKWLNGKGEEIEKINWGADNPSTGNCAVINSQLQK